MRGLAFASVAFVALALGCTAVDDFSKFRFVNDGGAHDLAGSASGDMGSNGLPGFGQACSQGCSGDLTCAKDFGGKSPAPGGTCTRSCATMGCGDLPNATCVALNGMPVCMPRCDPSQAQLCRSAYSCCNGTTTTLGPGACSPPTTDFCGH
jgi:hypothetical protein